MRGKVGGLSPPYFKSRGAIAPLAPLLPPPLVVRVIKCTMSEWVIDPLELIGDVRFLLSLQILKDDVITYFSILYNLLKK